MLLWNSLEASKCLCEAHGWKCDSRLGRGPLRGVSSRRFAVLVLATLLELRRSSQALCWLEGLGFKSVLSSPEAPDCSAASAASAAPPLRILPCAPSLVCCAESWGDRRSCAEYSALNGTLLLLPCAASAVELFCGAEPPGEGLLSSVDCFFKPCSEVVGL